MRDGENTGAVETGGLGLNPPRLLPLSWALASDFDFFKHCCLTLGDWVTPRLTLGGLKSDFGGCLGAGSLRRVSGGALTGLRPAPESAIIAGAPDEDRPVGAALG